MSSNDRTPPCLLSALRLPEGQTQTGQYENSEGVGVKSVAAVGKKETLQVCA